MCFPMSILLFLYSLISRGQDMVPDKLLNTIGICGRKHN